MEWFKISFRFYGPDPDFDYTGTQVYEAESLEEAEDIFWNEHDKSSYSILSIA